MFTQKFFLKCSHILTHITFIILWDSLLLQAHNLKYKTTIMDKKFYKDQIASMLPDRDEQDENYEASELTAEHLDEAADNKEAKFNAATLARMKMREKIELEKAERRKTEPTYGMTAKQKEKHELEQQRIQENITELEVIESSPEAQQFLSGGFSDLSPYAGTTKREVVKLLDSLNINLSLNLSQADTHNLLGCLLTCNEQQLTALYNNNRIPLAIKTVIKRMMEDAKLGNIETVEKLWDRIFGKAGKATLELPAASLPNVAQGIIPNTIVSREAYTIIRDTIIGRE